MGQGITVGVCSFSAAVRTYHLRLLIICRTYGMEMIPLLDVFVCCNAFLRPLIQCPKGTTFFQSIVHQSEKIFFRKQFSFGLAEGLQSQRVQVPQDRPHMRKNWRDGIFLIVGQNNKTVGLHTTTLAASDNDLRHTPTVVAGLCPPYQLQGNIMINADFGRALRPTHTLNVFCPSWLHAANCWRRTEAGLVAVIKQCPDLF